MRAPSDQSHLALVLTGGGARAAYQVGVLRLLSGEIAELLPDILTGVSAGGINAAFLAARQEPFADKSNASPRCGATSGSTTSSAWTCAIWRPARFAGAGAFCQPAALPAAVEKPGGHRSAPGAPRACAGSRGRRLAGDCQEPRSRLAARDRADGVELHDRPVDHLGAGARGARQVGVGAVAAQATRARCGWNTSWRPRRSPSFFRPSRSGAPGTGTGDPPDRAAVARHPPRRAADPRRDQRHTARGGGRPPVHRRISSPAQVAGVLFNAIVLNLLYTDALHVRRSTR